MEPSRATVIEAAEAPVQVAAEMPQPAGIEAPVESNALAASIEPAVEPAVDFPEITQPTAPESVMAEDAAVGNAVVATPPEAIAAEPVALSEADPAASRAEQLRGLFDNARQDPSPLPSQDAASEASRNA